MTNSTLPTIGDLFSDSIEKVKHQDDLNVILSHPPKKEWVKEHPFIKGYKYLPIDKIEFLLKKIFKQEFHLFLLVRVMSMLLLHTGGRTEGSNLILKIKRNSMKADGFM